MVSKSFTTTSNWRHGTLAALWAMWKFECGLCSFRAWPHPDNLLNMLLVRPSFRRTCKTKHASVRSNQCRVACVTRSGSARFMHFVQWYNFGSKLRGTAEEIDFKVRYYSPVQTSKQKYELQMTPTAKDTERRYSAQAYFRYVYQKVTWTNRLRSWKRTRVDRLSPIVGRAASID